MILSFISNSLLLQGWFLAFFIPWLCSRNRYMQFHFSHFLLRQIFNIRMLYLFGFFVGSAYLLVLLFFFCYSSFAFSIRQIFSPCGVALLCIPFKFFYFHSFQLCSSVIELFSLTCRILSSCVFLCSCVTILCSMFRVKFKMMDSYTS